MDGPIYGTDGQYRAYLAGGVIYGRDGRCLGVVEDNKVFAKSGNYVGQLVSGMVVDQGFSIGSIPRVSYSGSTPPTFSNRGPVSGYCDAFDHLVSESK